MLSIIVRFRTAKVRKSHEGHATFEDWAVKFEKTYSSDAELSYRKQVWEKTLIKIEKHNAELLEGKHTYGMGLNQFSDLTPEEFRMLYLTPREHLEDPQPVRFEHLETDSDLLNSEPIRDGENFYLASVQTGHYQLLILMRPKIGDMESTRPLHMSKIKANVDLVGHLHQLVQLKV